ncbi:integrator complex subunit 7-like [Tubulanus polymorphus]|uniref:integrator complex subunit 7-like n=1 Tax=Tubulanus polymorphus TaxID=672921 RepID=UPI003DA3A2AA
MAGFVHRLSNQDIGIGEPEKDANALLLELDKGLRSAKSGEQCEAIVKFPRLFEKYPFPILINSAFLKLADVFRTGSNFLRLCILKVTQQCQRHLDKIINVDEFIRRIFSVIHSNDAVARSLTLRTLGSMAAIIPERKNVHHSIVSSLDSHDAVELEAAIKAAAQFAAQSQSFSTSISQKLADMIKGLETPVEMKLKLIPIFQYMYHNSKISAHVRELCTEMLPSYPSSSFVLVTLHTLSLLAARSLVDIPNQIQLLLKYLESDPRIAVKLHALQDLSMLAKKGPHLWTHTDIQRLCKFTTEACFDDLSIGALRVLTALSKTLAVSKFEAVEGSPVLDIFARCNYHENNTIASKSAELLTDMAIHSVRADLKGSAILCQEATSSLDTLIMVCIATDLDSSFQSLKVCLKSVVNLCNSCPDRSSSFVSTIASELSTDNNRLKKSLLLAESLAAIGSEQRGSIHKSLSEVVHCLRNLDASNGDDASKMGVLLITIIFHAYIGNSLSQELCSLIEKFASSTNEWVTYKIVRSAMRYGHHLIASKLSESIMTKISREHFFYWLSAINNISKGETCLLKLQDAPTSIINTINEATVEYYKGISNLKAATTPLFPLSFPVDYMRLRVETLQAHIQLMTACTSFRTNPPPAIATSLAASTGQEQHKCGRGALQLQKCADLFSAIVNQYNNLYQASFDADPQTLNSILLLQQSCQLMIFLVDTVLNKKPSSDASYLHGMKIPQTLRIEQHELIDVFQLLLTELRQVANHSSSSSAGSGGLITFKHVDFLLRASQTIVRIPLCVPRYIFQSLQSTLIKLAISPQPRSSNEPVSVQSDTHLSVKIEGVVQHGAHPGLFRKIRSVRLTVNSVIQSRAQATNDGKPMENPTNDMEQVVEPHNDYFSAQFIFTFPINGLHVINIEASIIDQAGSIWKTGPKTNMFVKSYDDAILRAQQQAQKRNF